MLTLKARALFGVASNVTLNVSCFKKLS